MIAGRYTLDSEIGRGGMGVVWRGEDQVLGRDVALKRIGLAPGGASSNLLRAEREAKLAASLNHPNVVAVFDLVVENDEHWLVMEHVPSRNLHALVREKSKISPDEAATLLGQAADGLAAAHAAGIVHRDVKPSNILVTSEGRVKLTDFGIARASQDATLTQTGMVTGSPAYMAPEVASGESASPASDVWSLGATLYHALAGKPPYDVTDNMVAALYRIVHEDPPRLSEAGWLAPVLEGTMATDPKDRWTMAEVRDYLLAGPDGADQVKPTGTTALPTRLSRSGDTAETPADTPPQKPDRDDTGPRRRRATAWLVGAAAVVVAVLVVAAGLNARDDAGDGSTDTAGSSQPSPSATTPSSSEPTTEKSSSEPTTEEELETFASDYVSQAVSDPDASWQRLTPAFQNQSGGRSDYDRWWNQFESAKVRNVAADPEAMTVSYTVDYVFSDGRETSDDVTLQLIEQGGDLLVAGES